MVEVYQSIVVACVVIFSTFVWQTLKWVWLKPRRLEKRLRELGYKGSSYRLLIGDSKDNFKLRTKMKEQPIEFTNDYSSRINPFQLQHMEKYGKNCFTWMGPVPMLYITNPELARDVLSRTDEFVRPEFFNPLVRTLVPGLLSYEGEKWAKHRKLINPAFHVEKLKLMLPAFYATISDVVQSWEKMTLETGSTEIDVRPFLMNLSADAISRAAFSSSYEEGRKIFELLKEQTAITIALLQSPYIPGWRYMPSKTNRKMKVLNAEIEKLLMKIIEKRRRAMEAGEPAKVDLLGLLMESNIQNAPSQGGKTPKFAMTLQELIDECKLFYFAGQESTSVLLMWTMILLSKHQDWQTRAREEVLATFGMEQPDYDGLSKLKTVTMILHEVLRLYPPVVAMTRRVPSRETKLGDLTVPAGTALNLSVLQAHHDKCNWGDDALEFNPQRFSEGISKASKGIISFYPFGWGPRICIGQNFAILEAKMVVSMMLQRFSLELSPSYTHGPTTVLTLQPQYSANVILRPL